MSNIEVRFGKSFQTNASEAVKDLAAQVSDIDPEALIFFCSPKYDLPALGEAIKSTFHCPTIGCTTAGEILGSEGYIENSIICVAITSDKLTMKPVLIKDLRAFVKDNVDSTDSAYPDELKSLLHLDKEHCFTLLLIDGLSTLEEQVIAIINRVLQGIPMIGASAGDGADFKHTWVYCDGAFHENIAVLAVFETSLPFAPLHSQHFEPTDTRVVITDADVTNRTVTEIDGLPALEGYALAVDLPVDQMTPEVFAARPLMLKVGGEYYVRSVGHVNPDGSLVFFCAIDTGLVLTVAKHSTTLVKHLETALAKIHEVIDKPVLIFGSDCILRRLEMQSHGEMDETKRVLSQYPFIGFSTYGEQFCGVHVNHSLAALVLGDSTP